MPRRLPCLLLLIALLALAAPRPAAAQTPLPLSDNLSDKIISMDVTAGDLHAVAATLERQTHIQILVFDGPTLFKPVYVHLEDASLTKALRVIAQSAGASVTEITSDLYVFSPGDNPITFAPPVPAFPAPGSRLVQIQVAFVLADSAAIDSLPLKFEGEKPTQIAHGEEVMRLYRTLTRPPGKVILTPILTTNSGVATEISINTQIPLPLPTRFVRLQASLNITPRLNPDGSITLGIQSQSIVNHEGRPALTVHFPTLRRTVSSGETMVLRTPLAQADQGGVTFYANETRSPAPAQPLNGQEMLIFLTPTRIGESSDSAPANANGGSSVTVAP